MLADLVTPATAGEVPKRERSPPQSPQSPTAKHPRISVDLEDVLGKLEKVVADRNNEVFLQETVQFVKKLYEVTKDQANFLNRHAGLHEMHHESFFNASQAAARLREHITSSENDMNQIKDAMRQLRGDVNNVHGRLEDTIKRHDAQQLGEAVPMKDAIEYLNERINNGSKEVERPRGNIQYIEEKAAGAFDKIAK